MPGAGNKSKRTLEGTTPEDVPFDVHQQTLAAFKRTKDELKDCKEKLKLINQLKDELRERNKELEITKKDLSELNAACVNVSNVLQQTLSRVSELQKEVNDLKKSSRENRKKSAKFDKHDERRNIHCEDNYENQFKGNMDEHKELEAKTYQTTLRGSPQPYYSGGVAANHLYGEIRPGTVTHEEIQRQLTLYFTKYRRQFGSKVISSTRHHPQSLPCLVVQMAYNKCKDIVLKAVKKTIQESDLPQVEMAKSLLWKCRTSRITFEDSTTESILDEVDVLFKEPMKTEYKKVHWEELKFAFSSLLNCSGIDEKQIYCDLRDHALSIGNRPPVEMAEDVAKLTFRMVTLVPPCILCQPQYYIDDWHDKRLNYWEENSIDSLVYFRPIFFLSALGHVGCAGEVGNVIPKS